ncbi:MAG: GDSL-type esterase/lipase family protein [Bacteroidales bacterium]|nr:GDSL-type esterase/lipase family protein [Bacteroidales bacterium]
MKSFRINNILKTILGICFSISSTAVFGQSKIPYPFIVDSMNVICIPNKESSRLSNFYEKLNLQIRGCEDQLSILHIGGSHVQADMFSHQVRSHFDTLISDSHASRGIIFPFETAKTNNPSNYKVSHTGYWISSRNVRENRVAELGVMGIAVTTSDSSASITVNLNTEEEKHRWKFNRLTLIGYGDSRLVEPVLCVDDTTYIAVYDSVSSTYVYKLQHLAERFTMKIIQKDSVNHSFTVNGFIPENDNRGIVYHAIGVNGASVPSYLSCEHFERDLALIHPDLVIFAIGINDAVPENFSDSVFIANYDSLIAKIETVVPNCAYIFITNNDSFRKNGSGKSSTYSVNKNGLKVQRDFYELARRHDGGVWDMFAIMGGLSSMKQWEAFGLAQKDKIHFTRKGYKLMGDMIYHAIIDSYNNTMMKKR